MRRHLLGLLLSAALTVPQPGWAASSKDYAGPCANESTAPGTPQFLVVEDTNINGRPVDVDWQDGPGPGPAVDEWLPQHPEFEDAIMAKRYMVTFHTWLRRTE